MSREELSALAGLTLRRINDINKALPDDEKLFVPTPDGKYNAPVFVQHWVDYRISTQVGDAPDLETARTIHERIKTRKTELQVRRMAGQLVEVREIRRLWGDVANTVMQSMMRLPSKVAPLIVMMENAETIAGLIEREVRDVLVNISNTPLPDYAEGYDDIEMDDVEDDEP